MPRALALVVLLAACGGGGGAAIDGGRVDSSGGGGDGGGVDASTCTPPVIPPTTPASGPACTASGVPGECFDIAQCYGSRTHTARLCAGSAAIQCCTPKFADGVTCDPNAVPQPNACLVEAPGDAGCPAGMARVTQTGPTFCVDKFEGSLVETATGAPVSPYFPPPADGSVRAVSVRGAVPQGFISQIAAGAACEASGKRLCTAAEWTRACRGASDTTYPYGPTRMPGVCNDARATHPAIELYGTSDAWIYSHLDSPCLSQEANGLATTGSHAGCVTTEGAYDMMGNLHEWTAEAGGTFRGGFYVDTVLNGNGCEYATTAHEPSYDDYSTGFRCCADDVP